MISLLGSRKVLVSGGPYFYCARSSGFTLNDEAPDIRIYLFSLSPPDSPRRSSHLQVIASLVNSR
jgi:hypothetical protein